EVTELPQNEMTPYVVSNSDEAILIVHSPIVGLWFESNNIIHKLDKPDTGEYILHLRPGTHVILFRAREFLVKRKQFYITKKTYQEVRVEVLDPPEDQSLSELSTSLKDSLSAEQTISEKQQEVIAADKVGGRNENSFSKKHQLGIRLGVWHHQGDSPPEPDQLILSTDTNFKTNLKQSAFNFEGYFAYRLLSWAMVELSVGSVNRGSVTINEGTATDVGNLILYPILAQFKIYPLGTVISGFQPFMLAGGGFYYGRRTVQFTNSSDYYPNWQEDTGADINYIIGGGIDWPMANVLSLDLTVKYMPIKFSEPLVAMQNYNAVAFSIGIKYLYLK
ncbi:MAG: hypothetical protein U9R56_04120, partial [candidate division Zixibacteria bacterium]|nr:hypothetical protein [candidate division Zixibacteria bacterium]